MAWSRAQVVDRVGKPLVWFFAGSPLAFATWGLATGTLGAEPVREYQLATGLIAIRFLLASLAVTPLRRLTGVAELVRLRRLLGLWAFALASVHLLSYVVFDHEGDPASLWRDVVEHPWVLVGTGAWLLLLPLAVTSTQGWIRRLGRRWAVLHRLAYVAAVAAVLHFLWLVKKDLSEPALYGGVLVVLLALRLVPARRAARPTVGAPGVADAPKGV